MNGEGSDCVAAVFDSLLTVKSREEAVDALKYLKKHEQGALLAIYELGCMPLVVAALCRAGQHERLEREREQMQTDGTSSSLGAMVVACGHVVRDAMNNYLRLAETTMSGYDALSEEERIERLRHLVDLIIGA